MNFTPLHRALGLPPGPLTDEILNSAVDAKVSETDDLDWKAELPPIKGLSQTDVPKDIAAMANSGGGTIVYGVMEHQKVATERSDAGDFTEGHERAYRSVAVTAISPPVFGLEVQRLGTGPRAVAVTIPASVDGPHLIYRNDFFGAPIRNDADTAWMKERQIEAMYRARFDERRRANEALATLFAEAIENHNTSRQAWLVAVAHPRVPGGLTRLSRDVAREIFRSACSTTLRFSKRNGVHPLENVDSANPRPGLRRWIAPTTATGDSSTWKEAWASVHHDGSVTLSATIGGGHRKSTDGYFEGWEVESRGIECAVADFMALVRVAAQTMHHEEIDVQIGIEWSGEQPLKILTVDGSGFTYDGSSTPLQTFASVRSTITPTASDTDFHQQMHELAEDCVNQGGVTYLHIIEQLPQS